MSTPTATTKVQIYTTVDKTGWGPGPWQSEPDKMSWRDPTTGLPCLIVRNRAGNLCGYVGVPPAHPWHGKDYGACVDSGCRADSHYDCTPDGKVSVHGGLTYADRCDIGAPEATGICHIPGPDNPDDVWWFGFDTYHAWDLSPAYTAYRAPSQDEVYRDVGYVRRETESLASQLWGCR